MNTGILRCTVETHSGFKVPLSQYAGRILVIVNTASVCGYSHVNMTQLVEFHNKYTHRGLEVLAFPCNQFGAQEPLTASQAADWAVTKYNAKFPMMQHITCKGPLAHPMYQVLNNFGVCDWNYTKYIVGPDGLPLRKFHAQSLPMDTMAQYVETLVRR